MSESDMRRLKTQTWISLRFMRAPRPLSAELPRLDDLALIRPLDGGDIGLGDVGGGHAMGRVHVELQERFFHPRRTDGIDAEPPRHFQRRGADKTFEAGIDQRDRGAARHRLDRQHAGGHGDRAAVAEVILGGAGERHLSHQLAAQAKLVVSVGELGERLEHRVAGARHHRVDVAHSVEHGADRSRLVEIDLDGAVARSGDDLVPVRCERLGDRGADGAGGSDHDDLHDLPFSPPRLVQIRERRHLCKSTHVVRGYDDQLRQPFFDCYHAQ